MTKKFTRLNKLIEKITNTNTSNNAEFDYYGYHITMLSGTIDYTNVTIQNKSKNVILQFTLDFLTKECDIEYYEDYNLRDSLVNTLNELYYGTMRFTDPVIEEELDFWKRLAGNPEYDQDYVMKEYDNIVKHKLIKSNYECRKIN